jgi:hypothetical protein
MKPVPKTDRRDKAYLDHCRLLCRLWRVACFVCDARDGTVVPHHVKGKRRFGDKWNVLYLCGTCHRQLHTVGRETFYRLHNTSHAAFSEEAVRLYDEWLEIQARAA